MNPARKATPDSEALASSEDEKPWPASRSFGKFPMGESGVPGLPGGIWSATRSGSFKMDKAKLDAARASVRLTAPHQPPGGIRGTPSPSVGSEGNGNGSLPFSFPLQPTPKTGRSLSHSQGQREYSQAGATHSAALPLGLLTEEADTESESEMGSKLTQTTSHPPIRSLLRGATMPLSFDQRDSSNGSEYHDHSPVQPAVLRGRTFEAAFANLSLDQPTRRAQWQSSLGWDDVPHINESRRHSLADIPTRRGSLAAGEPSMLSRAFTNDPQEMDEHATHYQGYASDHAAEPGMTRAQELAEGLNIPMMYRVPHVELNPTERLEIEVRRDQQAAAHSSALQWGQGSSRPRKLLYIVSFKCSRVDCFYLLENTGLNVREGDLVIVEADRGQDLGTVQHANVTPDAARLLKRKYSEEQYKWLMMYSRNKDGAINPNAQLHGESPVSTFQEIPHSMQGVLPRENYNNLKPKAIKRLANEHEIRMLAEKEGNEAKAKRTCQQKVQHLRLQMEILDAEWQWDFQKLIFYYYADHYINFKDLITELYRIYKTRIWLSAINPASFSQHAMGQPPSGIGPGAVGAGPQNPFALNNAYTMAYGEDRDPYGAQMPYRIPYDTYTPNWPAIPGVANSFAPSQIPPGQNFLFYNTAGPAEPSNNTTAVQRSTPQNNDRFPSTDPMISQTGELRDYNYFYDHSGNNEHLDLVGMGVATGPDPQRLREHNIRANQSQAANPFMQVSMGSITFHPPPPYAPIRQPRPPQPPIGTRPASNDKQSSSTRPQPRFGYKPQEAVFGQQVPPADSAVPDATALGLAGGFEKLYEMAIPKHERQEAEANSKAGIVNRYIMDLPNPNNLNADGTVRER